MVRPRGAALTVSAIVVVVVCVMLGLWQLDRLHGRREINARFAAGLAAAPQPLEKLLADGGALGYRRTIATGRYDTEREVILYGRTLDGRAGNDVLTPLLLADGRAVIVDRGWVPFEMDEPPVTAAQPPSGVVEVEGPLVASQPGGAGEIQPEQTRVTTVRSVDIEAIAKGAPYRLVPWFLQLRTQSPAPDSLPIPQPQPELTEGPHLGYAFQWFAFATIAAVGYAILVRREIRERRTTTAV